MEIHNDIGENNTHNVNQRGKEAYLELTVLETDEERESTKAESRVLL